jgi:hypothetical protein
MPLTLLRGTPNTSRGRGGLTMFGWNLVRSTRTTIGETRLRVGVGDGVRTGGVFLPPALLLRPGTAAASWRVDALRALPCSTRNLLDVVGFGLGLRPRCGVTRCVGPLEACVGPLEACVSVGVAGVGRRGLGDV